MPMPRLAFPRHGGSKSKQSLSTRNGRKHADVYLLRGSFMAFGFLTAGIEPFVSLTYYS